MRTKFLKNLGKIIFILCLINISVSCSGGGGGSGDSTAGSAIKPPIPTDNGSVNNLQIITPYAITQVGTQNSSNYIVVKNTASTTISNIKYTMQSDLTGVILPTIDASSTDKCASITGQSSCTLQINTTANVTSGVNLSLVVSNQNTQSSNTIKTLSNDKSLTLGVQNISNLNLTNDKFALFYDKTVAKNTTGNTLVNLTMVITQATTANSIFLVDSSGNEVAEQTVISGNSGAGLGALSVGSIVSILVTIPQNTDNLPFYIKMANITTDGTQSDVVINTTLNNIALKDNVGVLKIVPQQLIFSESITSQYVSLFNNSNFPISALSLNLGNVQNATITKNTCSDTIAAGELCYILIEATKPSAMYADLTTTYSDGVDNITNTVSALPVSGNVTLTDLTDSSHSDSGSTFIRKTIDAAILHTYKITNNGDSYMNNVYFDDLPAGFMLQQSDTNSCTLNNNTITNILNVGDSCQFVLSYDSQTATIDLNSSTLGLNYNFVGADAKKITEVINYQTIQSQAVLTTNLNTLNFNPIKNNNNETQHLILTLTNTGDDIAHNINYSLDNSVYSVDQILTTCGISLDSGQSCDVMINFGPTSVTATQNATGNIEINFVPFTGSAQQQLPITANGVIRDNISPSMVLSSVNVTKGDKITQNNVDTYYIAQGTVSPVITLTFTNIGTDTAQNVYSSFQAVGNLSLLNSSCGTSSAMVSIVRNATCSVVYTINSNSPTWSGQLDGSNGVLNGQQIYYNDAYDGEYTLDNINYNGSTIIYYPQRQVNMTLAKTSLGYLESTSLTYSLSGGYVAQTATVVATPNLTNQTNVTLSPSSCSLNAQNPVCKIQITGNNQGNSVVSTITTMVSDSTVQNLASSVAITTAAFNNTWSAESTNMTALAVESGKIATMFESTNTILYLANNGLSSGNLLPSVVMYNVSNNTIKSLITSVANLTTYVQAYYLGLTLDSNSNPYMLYRAINSATSDETYIKANVGSQISATAWTKPISTGPIIGKTTVTGDITMYNNTVFGTVESSGFATAYKINAGSTAYATLTANLAGAKFPVLANYNNTKLYLAYESSNGTLLVKQWSGVESITSFNANPTGVANIPTTVAKTGVNIAFKADSLGALYLAFSSNADSSIQLYKLVAGATSWTTNLPSIAMLSGQTPNIISMAIDNNNNPIIAYISGNKVNVMRFKNNIWLPLTGTTNPLPSSFASGVRSLGLTVNKSSGKIYVSLNDSGNANKLAVYSFN